MEASDKTALQCVMEVDEERTRLEAEAAELTKLGDEGSERYKVAYCPVWCIVSFTKSLFCAVHKLLFVVVPSSIPQQLF